MPVATLFWMIRGFLPLTIQFTNHLCLTTMYC